MTIETTTQNIKDKIALIREDAKNNTDEASLKVIDPILDLVEILLIDIKRIADKINTPYEGGPR